MGAEDVKNVVLEKLHELLLLLVNFGGYLLSKFDDIFPPETRWKKGAEDVKNVVLEKLHELLLLLESVGGYVLSKFDEIFPPDTRGKKLHHLILVIAPFLITGLVLITCLRCCCRCCCGRGSSLIRMMKAPGRNYRMPRNVFESNPRSYFRDLRASSSTKSPHIC